MSGYEPVQQLHIKTISPFIKFPCMHTYSICSKQWDAFITWCCVGAQLATDNQTQTAHHLVNNIKKGKLIVATKYPWHPQRSQIATISLFIDQNTIPAMCYGHETFEETA